MTETVLLIWTQLGSSAVVLRYKKDRVIAEATFALWCFGDATLPGALADNGRRIFCMAHIDHQALEAGTAFGLRNAGHGLQQFFQTCFERRSYRTLLEFALGRLRSCDPNLQPPVAPDRFGVRRSGPAAWAKSTGPTIWRWAGIVR